MSKKTISKLNVSLISWFLSPVLLPVFPNSVNGTTIQGVFHTKTPELPSLVFLFPTYPSFSWSASTADLTVNVNPNPTTHHHFQSQKLPLVSCGLMHHLLLVSLLPFCSPRSHAPHCSHGDLNAYSKTHHPLLPFHGKALGKTLSPADLISSSLFHLIYSSHTDFLSIPWTHHSQSCLKVFAHALPSAWSPLPPTY